MDPIGREAEVAEVARRVLERRLVTLVGPGGIGKTTLARAVLDRVGGQFADGTRVVDLTRVDTPGGVDSSFASQLGYASFTSLLDAPGDHTTLLLIDSCEHVLDAVADATERLLDACEMPTVLATSRIALEVQGEVVVPIGPLTLPPPGGIEGDAVDLFVTRAADAGHPVERTEAIAELCRRLDGVPLAIELAAARTRSLTAEEILARLGAGLDVLDRPRRRGASRHQSLRATIDWSWDLLTADEQQLLGRLGVFAGPFSAATAHAVAAEPGSSAADVEDTLDRLVAASLVVATNEAGATSYRLLDTIRTRALDHLESRGERDRFEARFVDHVVDRAAGIIARGASGWAPDVLRDLLDLYGNLSAAVRWCLDHDDEPDRALLMTAVLWGVIHQAHTEEIGRLAEAVLARWPDTTHPLRADAIATWATCRYMLGDDAGAIAAAEGALPDAARSPFAAATLWRAIAQARRAQGDTAGSLDAFEKVCDAAREQGLRAMANEAECARAQILADVGSIDEALAIVTQVQRASDDDGLVVSSTWARTVEGSILLRRDPDAAARLLDDVIEDARRIRYPASVSVAQRALGLAGLLTGDLPGAARAGLALLDQLLEAGSTYELRSVLDIAAPALSRAGRTAVACDLAATALALPVVSITASVGHELVPLDATGGRVMGVRDAIVATREELGRLVAGEGDSTEDQVPAGPRADRSGDGGRHGTFRQRGDTWEVGLADEVVTVRASKGLADLATLIAEPGREHHCLELIGAGLDEAGAGPTLDDAARRSYEARVRELQADIDDADANHDAGRAERARLELDALVDQLTAALGLGGRSRSTASSAERARSAVTQRIRTAMRRIDDANPRLGRHLHASVRTGTFCSYQPEEPVHWAR